MTVLTLKNGNDTELKYIIKYPKSYKEGEKYPVLIFMHGAGSRGKDTTLLRCNPFYEITDKMDLPFITVAPLCHSDTWFCILESVIAFIKNIYNCEFCDKSRFYLMGASMGGYASWQIGMSVPELFAAIVPICGGGMAWNASRLKNIPVWAFHGEADKTVPLTESIKMVDAVNKAGGNARLTVYGDCGHDAWSETYSNKEVYDWLLGNIKTDIACEKTKLDNPEIYG